MHDAHYLIVGPVFDVREDRLMFFKLFLFGDLLVSLLEFLLSKASWWVSPIVREQGYGDHEQ